jgi:hypothetical protein
VGRPDLAGRTADWTPFLWESIVAARSAWPPSTVILPAHYASERERRADRAVAASFGDLLAGNEALRFGDREAFAAWVENRTSVFPDAYKQIKAVNVGLVTVDDARAEELEVGRNECALGKT